VTQKAKVLVGMPVGNTVEPGLVETMQRAIALHPSEGYASPVQVIAYRVTNQARNMLVQKLLKGDWTHLFMLDDDMIYPSGTLARLLQADKDIIAPFYVRKVRGFMPNAFADDAKGWHTIWCDRLVQVAAMGTGGMLIKRKIFETLEPQWFHYDIYPEPNNNRIEQKSEDVVFCDKARAAGFEIWCEGRLKCGHIGTFVVWPGLEIEDKPGYGAVKVEPYEPLEENDYGY
jgi:hypothetical protein